MENLLRTMDARQVTMPDPRSFPEPGSGKWRTIQAALGSWSGTARLCLIYLTMNIPVDALIWLLRH